MAAQKMKNKIPGRLYIFPYITGKYPINIIS